MSQPPRAGLCRPQGACKPHLRAQSTGRGGVLPALADAVHLRRQVEVELWTAQETRRIKVFDSYEAAARELEVHPFEVREAAEHGLIVAGKRVVWPNYAATHGPLAPVRFKGEEQARLAPHCLPPVALRVSPACLGTAPDCARRLQASPYHFVSKSGDVFMEIDTHLEKMSKTVVHGYNLVDTGGTTACRTWSPSTSCRGRPSPAARW